jgi:hypothetical protein
MRRAGVRRSEAARAKLKELPTTAAAFARTGIQKPGIDGLVGV